MKSLSIIIDNYLKGKAIFLPIRRILDIIFSASITSFLFQRFYFKYHLLDITDYKGIIDFFLNGSFFVPLGIFLFVHFGIYVVSSLFFTLSTTRKSSQWVKDIIASRFTKRDLRAASRKINKHSIAKKYIQPTPSWFVETYLIVKENIETQQWKNAEENLRKENQNIEKNFLLNVKAILAISVYYFFSAPYFGTLLYVSCTLVLVILVIFLWYCYLFLDVLPTLVRKIDVEMQGIIKTEQENEMVM